MQMRTPFQAFVSHVKDYSAVMQSCSSLMAACSSFVRVRIESAPAGQSWVHSEQPIHRPASTTGMPSAPICMAP